MTPDEFLLAYPPEMRAVANRARALVRENLPSSTEQVKTGWQALTYHLPTGPSRVVYVGFVLPHADSVSLGFSYGVLLDDPDHVLLGAGERLKRVRYVSLRSVDDIDPILHGRFARQAGELTLMPRPLREQMLAFGERYPAGEAGGMSLPKKMARRGAV
jgi:hypothetical protein